MFGKRRQRGRHHRDERADGASPPQWAQLLYADEADTGEFGSAAIQETFGPYDDSEAPEDQLARLDLGSVRVPVPDNSQLQVEVEPSGGPVRAVHILTPIGRLTVSAFAAPRSSRLWPEICTELMRQLREDGARVYSEGGAWGSEVVASSPQVALRFIGVDGPRWLLRGVAAGPVDHAAELSEILRSVVRDTVVERGVEPLPVRTPLALRLPDAIAAHIEQDRPNQTPT
jgi:hypothetical protein